MAHSRCSINLREEKGKKGGKKKKKRDKKGRRKGHLSGDAQSLELNSKN